MSPSRASIVTVAAFITLAACQHDIGGPVDRRYPEEAQIVRRLDPPAGRAPVVIVAVSGGEHYAGASPGCSTRSEAGIAVEGARAGDIFRVDLFATVPGATFAASGRALPHGVRLGGRTRFATRDEATRAAAAAAIESCRNPDGTRLALRASLTGPPDGEWTLLDLTDPTRPRWGATFTGEGTCQAIATTGKPAVWNDPI